MKLRTRLIVAVASISFLGLVAIFGLYRESIMTVIQHGAIKLRITPYSSLLAVLLIVIVSIPPMIGFVSSVTLTGFVYGFPGGIIPATTGAMIGSSLAFWIIRRYPLARFVHLSPAKQATYKALEEAIEQGGLRIMILLRLCPLPWPLVTLLFSMIPNSRWSDFLIATGVGMIKVTLEVWIGSQLANLSDPNLPPSAHRVALGMMCGGFVLLLAIGFWLYRLTMAKVRQLADREIPENINETQQLLIYKQPDLEALETLETLGSPLYKNDTKIQLNS
ncbi:hypothetical protein J3Q64DRAFT_1422050 [Phycomyces blakesleeanus]|uniref:Golgi apparatus membrane protein TVP38 n=1 Tax=Phycomyces blakesleeanus TaxID=4837 RepID=A0ABR3AH52_PHYBL